MIVHAQSHHLLIPLLWIAWLIYWKVAARNTKRTARRESVGSLLSHAIPFFVAWLLLLLPDRGRGILFTMPWPRTGLTHVVGVVLMLLGFGITIWARRILGRNWSGTVTMKENHELVQTGPYRWVRHPIYTGLLLAFLGTAVALGEWRGFVAVGLVLLAFAVKLRIEERWMIELFGPTYLDYQKRVHRLIPFVW